MSQKTRSSLFMLAVLVAVLVAIIFARAQFEAFQRFEWMGLSTYALLILGLGVPSLIWGMIRRRSSSRE